MNRDVWLLIALGLGWVESTSIAQAPSFRWVQTLGGSASTYLDHLVVDSDGNRYAVGTFKGTFTSGSQVLTSSGEEQNVYVCKTTPEGQTLWARKVIPGGTGSLGASLSVQDALVDGHGGLVLAGWFESRATFGEVVLNSRGADDIFLVRYDPVGNVAWVRQAGGNGSDLGMALRTDAANNLYLTGWIGMSPSLDDFFEPYPSIAFFGGGLGGGPTLLLTGINAGFLAKYDHAGALLWAQQFAGGESLGMDFLRGPGTPGIVGEQNARSILTSFDENTGLQPPSPFSPIQGSTSAEHALVQYVRSEFAAVGSIEYGGRIVVGPVALDAAATSWWFLGQSALFGRSLLTGEITFARNTDQDYAVVAGAAGEFYIFPPYDASNGRVARLDPISGAELWSVPTRGARVRAVTPLPDGSLLVGGDGSGTISLGSFTLNTAGESTAFIARVSATPAIDWVRYAGGALAHASAESVAVDPAGNRYVTGWFRGDASFSGHPQKSVQSSTDGFLAKYDKAGTLVWVRSFGGKDWDVGRSVAVDRVGNCYVAGEFNATATFGASTLVSKGYEDLFVAKYNGEGNLLWVRQAGGPGEEYPGDIVVDPGGNCFVTGGFSQTAEFGDTSLISQGSRDVVLAKYSPGGTLVWAKRAGGSADDRGFGITSDATGNLFVTGFFTTYATFGTIDVPGYAGHDVFLAKYDASGKALWVSKAGGSGTENAYAVALDASGNSYITGILRSASDFGGIPVPWLGFYDIFVAKFSPAGKCLWAKCFGSTTADDQAEGIAVDRAGNCYVTGEFKATAAFGSTTLTSKGAYDAVLLKLDGNSGDVLWAKQVGSTGDDIGYSLAIEGDQNWTWAGMFRGTVAFDDQTVVATAEDFFLANSVAAYNPRAVAAGTKEGVLGSNVSIPVWLGSQGDENALSFTLKFDPTALTNVTVVSGDGTTPSGLSQLLLNSSRSAEGLLGVTAAATAGTTLAAGGHLILTIQATVIAGTTASLATLEFGDEVLLREIDDARGQYLNADFIAGALAIIRGYEGDVMPPGGDNQVTLTDWIKAGRFAAHLDVPAPGDESTRADCSPYVVNDVFIGGDGAFSLGDWIQIGRLAAGLDPIRPQGGPGQGLALAALREERPSRSGPALAGGGSRQVRATSLELAPGQSGDILVELQAAGDENAAAFSLTIDPVLLEFQGASLTAATTGGTLLVNPNHLGSGQLGLLVALPAGAHLEAGSSPLVAVRVKATTAPGTWTNAVDFLDFPVKRQVVDANALELPATHAGSRVTIVSNPVEPPRIAEVRRVDGALEFQAAGFSTGSVSLEVSENLRDWTPLPVEPGPTGVITVPFVPGATARFYRLVGQ